MIGRPDASEYPPHAQTYIDCTTGDNVLDLLSEQLTRFHAIFTPLDLSVAATYRYEPGKWSINEVLSHITDTERIYNYRLLRIARGDTESLPGFNHDNYVKIGDFNRRTLADMLSEFEAVRHSTMRLIHGLPAESWMRRGTVNGHSVTPRGIGFLIAGHEKHHANLLRDRYLKVTAS